jgi:hypothetical protein
MKIEQRFMMVYYMYIYIYICINIYVYICIHIYLCIYIYLYTIMCVNAIRPRGMSKQSQCKYNVKLRHVRVTIVAEEKQYVLYILSLSYHHSNRIFSVPHYIVTCCLSGCTTLSVPHYTVTCCLSGCTTLSVPHYIVTCCLSGCTTLSVPHSPKTHDFF